MNPEQAAASFASEVQAHLEARKRVLEMRALAYQQHMGPMLEAVQKALGAFASHLMGLSAIPGTQALDIGLEDHAVFFEWRGDQGDLRVVFAPTRDWGINFQVGSREPKPLIHRFDDRRPEERAVYVVVNALRDLILPKLAV